MSSGGEWKRERTKDGGSKAVHTRKSYVSAGDNELNLHTKIMPLTTYTFPMTRQNITIM